MDSLKIAINIPAGNNIRKAIACNMPCNKYRFIASIAPMCYAL